MLRLSLPSSLFLECLLRARANRTATLRPFALQGDCSRQVLSQAHSSPFLPDSREVGPQARANLVWHSTSFRSKARANLV